MNNTTNKNKPFATIFAFVDNVEDAALLASKGFDVEIDDAVNTIFYAEKQYESEDVMFDDSINVPYGMGISVEFDGKMRPYWVDDKMAVAA